MMRVIASYLVALFALAISASHARAESFDHTGLVMQVIERHIRPGYDRLHDATQMLNQAARTFCGNAPETDMTPLRDAFRTTVLAWSRISHLRFGPVSQERRLTRMLYWPDRKSLGRKQVRKAIRSMDKSVLNEVTLAQKSVAVQGLGAIEQLLYWKAEKTLGKTGEQRSHRCGYLLAASRNIDGISAALVSEWSPEGAFPKVLLSPGKNNPRYLKPSESTLEIAKAFLVGLERLRDIKVAGSLGLRPNNRSRVRVPFEPSGLSTRAMQAELEGLIDMYENGGLMQVIKTHEPGMGKSIRYELGQAHETFKRIALPIAKVLENPDVKDELINTGFPLKNARLEAARVLAGAAGLNLGFNALDGD